MGVPPFGSVGRSPFGFVNLQNLNWGFAIPMISHAGRGMGFQYNLSYNSTIYAKVRDGKSGLHWQLDLNNGWLQNGPIGQSDNRADVVVISKGCQQSGIDPAYIDPTGNRHVFPALDFKGCLSPPPILSAYALDASGYFIDFGVGVVRAPDGTTIVPGGAFHSDADGNILSRDNGSITDVNGNQIT